MPRSHLTWAMPYHPGTISRSGNPCWGGSGCPLMAQASITSSRRHSASGRLRSYCCSISPWTPPSRPVEATSPELAQGSRREEGAAVARAFEGDRDGRRGPALQLFEAEVQRMAYLTAHRQRPGRWIHRRDAEMDVQGVKTDRRVREP